MTSHANTDTSRIERQREEQSEKRWADFLNATVGLLGFSLGLGCLGTKTPPFNAMISLLFVLGIWARGRHLVPAHFKSEHAATRRTLKERLRFWRSTGPAVFGYAFLSFIIASNPLAQWCMSIHFWPGFVHFVHAYVGMPG
jgi:hypothetical protein